ncbi:hypothetical protein O7605_15925 [Verrucosispora sp. WMMA2121]|uniref:hypothetical protein n=1 Tax=Verrucosispora sp. WMMA2121 TaxID=3015164 RepID=UPI0022B6C51E|nr:hypothetical protein [Verrucosispora sp. WMMA2121]MCZ7421001.1 hypothetical protein [Verrucosispora sp. WMMA2121]
MTGSRAARDHSDGPSPDAGPNSAASRTQVVAPQPRAVPSPAPDGAAGPDRADSATVESPTGVEVEPTTGAPADTLPRRVPVRPVGRRGRRHRSRDDGTPDEDTFWAPIEQVHWDGTPVRQDTPGGTDPWWQRFRPARRRRERSSHPPDPLAGLSALIGLSLAAAFFAWVSAGPLWLAVGHATSGAVVVTRCSGDGLTQRCRGIFTATEEEFRIHGVRVSGVPRDRAVPGSVLPARVTGPDGHVAYADRGVGAQLRWLLGMLAVLGCALGIARWTGATRLPDPTERRWAVAASLAGPPLTALGFLIAAW